MNKKVFWTNAAIFYFVFIKEINKKFHVPKNMKQHNSFNTHNKSAY